MRGTSRSRKKNIRVSSVVASTALLIVGLSPITIGRKVSVGGTNSIRQPIKGTGFRGRPLYETLAEQNVLEDFKGITGVDTDSMPIPDNFPGTVKNSSPSLAPTLSLSFSIATNDRHLQKLNDFGVAPVQITEDLLSRNLSPTLPLTDSPSQHLNELPNSKSTVSATQRDGSSLGLSIFPLLSSVAPTREPSIHPSGVKNSAMKPTTSSASSSNPSQKTSNNLSSSSSPSIELSYHPTEIPSLSNRPPWSVNPSYIPSMEPTSSPSTSSAPNGPSPQQPSEIPSISLKPTTSVAPSRISSLVPSGLPSVSKSPTNQPSEQPSELLTISFEPTMSTMPSNSPSQKPFFAPSSSVIPSGWPSINPSEIPSISLKPTTIVVPSRIPSLVPGLPSRSKTPTKQPSEQPSELPTISFEPMMSTMPSNTPPLKSSLAPSSNVIPSRWPSINPSETPSTTTSVAPSRIPSLVPSGLRSRIKTPTNQPSEQPGELPTISFEPMMSTMPSNTPSLKSSLAPSSSAIPSGWPSIHPSEIPSITTSVAPSRIPSLVPSDLPSVSKTPTNQPSGQPSGLPTISFDPTVSTMPSSSLSLKPSLAPSSSVIPSGWPSIHPSEIPSISLKPTTSVVPSRIPSLVPSDLPSLSKTPTYQHSGQPSELPTLSGSLSWSVSHSNSPSVRPNLSPPTSSAPNELPLQQPSEAPSSSLRPTDSSSPSNKPSTVPTSSPSTSEAPSVQPSAQPSLDPSASLIPSKSPIPSAMPTSDASHLPTKSLLPSEKPSAAPSLVPRETIAPSVFPFTLRSGFPSLSSSPIVSAAPSIVPSSGPTSSPSGSTQPSHSFSPSNSNGPSIGPSAAPSPRGNIFSHNDPIQTLDRAPSVSPSADFPSEAPSLLQVSSNEDTTTPTISLANQPQAVKPSQTPTTYAVKIPTIQPTRSSLNSLTDKHTQGQTELFAIFSPTEPPSELNTVLPTSSMAHPTTEFSRGPLMAASPTESPTSDWTYGPTLEWTYIPTSQWTYNPTPEGTYSPTPERTLNPTLERTYSPTPERTLNPTKERTSDPTPERTFNPTPERTFNPTRERTINPTSKFTEGPTVKPSPGLDPALSTSPSSSADGTTPSPSISTFTNLLTTAEEELTDSMLRSRCAELLGRSFTAGSQPNVFADKNKTIPPNLLAPLKSFCSLMTANPSSPPSDIPMAPSALPSIISTEPSHSSSQPSVDNYSFTESSSPSSLSDSISPTKSAIDGSSKEMKAYNNFQLLNVLGMDKAALEQSSHFVVLNKAYSTFIKDINADFSSPSRRHLKASIDPKNASIYRMVDSHCPKMVAVSSEKARCVVAYGSFDIIYSPDEDARALYQKYVTLTQVAIENGRLQKEIERSSPETARILIVLNSTSRSIPVKMTQRDKKKIATRTLIISISAVILGIAFWLVVFVVGIRYYKRRKRKNSTEERDEISGSLDFCHAFEACSVKEDALSDVSDHLENVGFSLGFGSSNPDWNYRRREVNLYGSYLASEPSKKWENQNQGRVRRPKSHFGNEDESLAYTLSSEATIIKDERLPLSSLDKMYEIQDELSSFDEDKAKHDLIQKWESNGIIDELKSRLKFWTREDGDIVSIRGFSDPEMRHEVPADQVEPNIAFCNSSKEDAARNNNIDVRLSWIRGNKKWFQVIHVDDGEAADSQSEYDSDDTSTEGPQHRWVRANNSWVRIRDERAR